jgi:hypothetical protein
VDKNHAEKDIDSWMKIFKKWIMTENWICRT